MSCGVLDLKATISGRFLRSAKDTMAIASVASLGPGGESESCPCLVDWYNASVSII